MTQMAEGSVGGVERRQPEAGRRGAAVASADHHLDAPAEWVRQLGHRPDRVTAGGRAALAVVSLLVEWLDSRHPSSHPEIVQSILAGYFVYAVLLAIARWRSVHREIGRGALLRQVFDMIVVALLMALTGGPESPYFMFFPFVLISGALFWRWRGALLTSLAAFGILVVLVIFDPTVMIDPDTNQTMDVSRIAFVAVSAILLVWLGLREDGVQASLRRIVSHPMPLQTSREWPWDAALEYAAHVTWIPRLALTWTDPDEQLSYAAISDYGRRQLLRIEAELDDDWETTPPRLGDSAAPHQQVSPENVSRTALLRSLGATTVIALPFDLATMQGELLVLDPPILSAEQEAIAGIVGQRVALLFDQARQFRRMLEHAELQQRVHIAHNLHDGVLQTLTGTTLQLEDVRTLAAHAPERVARRVLAIQQMLAEEQRVLRQLINRLEINDAPASQRVPLEPRLADLAARLRAQWALNISHAVEPPMLALPIRLIDEICHLATEATSNAAKHGQATTVTLLVQCRGSLVEITVTDDGTGFSFGREVPLAELSARNLGPVRLRERAARCAGSMSIDDRGGRTVVRVQIPLEARA
nr:histidine kinase [Paracoccus saliphilus]